jgi:hypothetical protein
MNKTVYHSLCIFGIIIIICFISYGRIIEGFEDIPSIELAKSYVDAAQANRKAINSTNINITTAKTDIDGISNALSNTSTRITTAISLIVSRTNTVIMNSANSNIKKLLLKNVFMVAKISKDVTMTANSLLNTLSNMISIPVADRDLVKVEWNGALDTIKNVVLSIQKIASVIIDISPKLSILGTENTNSEVIQQLAATQEQTNNDAETAQLGFLAVKAKIAEVKKAAAEREAASKAVIESAESAQIAAASRTNTADYLSYITKAVELAQAVINSPSVSEANKAIWRVKAAEQKTRADRETARIAAEKEAARIAAEREAARIAAEKEAARIAAEREAARIAAEKEAIRIAAEREAARLAQIEADKKAAAAAAAAEKAAQQKEAERIAKEEAAVLAAKKAADDVAAVKAASARLAVLFSNIAASNAAQAAEIAERADAEAARAADAKAAAEADVQKARAAASAAADAIKNAAAEAAAATSNVSSAQQALNMLSIRSPVRSSRAAIKSVPFGETPEQKTTRLAAEAAEAQEAARIQQEADNALQQKKNAASAALQAAKEAAASTAARSTEVQKAAEAEAANAKAAADKAAAALQAAIKAKAAADKAAAAKKAASDAIASASLIAEDAWKGAARYGCRNLMTSAAAFDNMTCNDNEYIYGFQKVNNAYQYTCCNVPKGIDGSGGLPGFQGPTGPQGSKGSQGSRGKQGSQGPRGLQGEQGERGEVGPQGVQGIQGRKGAFGIEGEMGNPTTVSSDVKVKQTAGPPGRKGEDGPRGPSGVQGQQGPDGTKGERGRNGINGLPGDKGEKGERGERGPDGRKGPRGKMADIIEPPSITSYLKKGFTYVQDRIKNFIITKQNESIIHHM